MLREGGREGGTEVVVVVKCRGRERGGRERGTEVVVVVKC